MADQEDTAVKEVKVTVDKQNVKWVFAGVLSFIAGIIIGFVAAQKSNKG